MHTCKLGDQHSVPLVLSGGDKGSTFIQRLLAQFKKHLNVLTCWWEQTGTQKSKALSIGTKYGHSISINNNNNTAWTTYTEQHTNEAGLGEGGLYTQGTRWQEWGRLHRNTGECDHTDEPTQLRQSRMYNYTVVLLQVLVDQKCSTIITMIVLLLLLFYDGIYYCVYYRPQMWSVETNHIYGFMSEEKKVTMKDQENTWRKQKLSSIIVYSINNKCPNRRDDTSQQQQLVDFHKSHCTQREWGNKSLYERQTVPVSEETVLTGLSLFSQWLFQRLLFKNQSRHFRIISTEDPINTE